MKKNLLSLSFAVIVAFWPVTALALDKIIAGPQYAGTIDNGTLSPTKICGYYWRHTSTDAWLVSPASTGSDYSSGHTMGKDLSYLWKDRLELVFPLSSVLGDPIHAKFTIKFRGKGKTLLGDILNVYVRPRTSGADVIAGLNWQRDQINGPSWSGQYYSDSGFTLIDNIDFDADALYESPQFNGSDVVQDQSGNPIIWLRLKVEDPGLGSDYTVDLSSISVYGHCVSYPDKPSGHTSVYLGETHRYSSACICNHYHSIQLKWVSDRYLDGQWQGWVTDKDWNSTDYVDKNFGQPGIYFLKCYGRCSVDNEVWNVSDGLYVNVMYALNTSVSPSGGGSVTKNPDKSSYSYNESVQLTANPSSGYTFSNWSGDASGSSNPTSVTMNSNKSVTANFTANTYTLSTSVSPSGAGSVTKSPSKSSYSYNDSVQLTANASSGYTFSNWSGDASGSSNPTTITMNSNKSVTANFTAIQTGSLKVTLGPSGAVSAGAQWNVDGGAWQNSEDTVTGLSVGSHTVNYKTVTGWTAPPSEQVTINNGRTTAISRNYTQQTGSLQVTLGPGGAVSAGAQWNVDGGAWQNSGGTVTGLSVGSHTVNYKSITGWTAPPSEQVTINNGQTTAISRNYTQQTGSLQVTLGPGGAVSAGAQWNVDGGAWQNSGATVTGLSVGSHTVNYKAVAGWTAPPSEQVNINSGETTSISRNYTQQTDAYGMRITSCTISDTTPDPGQSVTLSNTGGEVHGASSSDLIKVVVGFRDGSGNWVGGEPVVVSSTVPGLSWQPWSGSNAVISVPSTPGTYYVWVRSVPTVDSATGIQDFKDATPTSPDEVRDDRWDAAVVVQASAGVSVDVDASVEGVQKTKTIAGLNIGDLIVVQIWAESVTNMSGFDATIVFDVNSIECQGAVEGPFLKSAGGSTAFIPDINNATGKTTITGSILAATMDTSPEGNGSLAEVTFKILEKQTSTISITMPLFFEPTADGYEAYEPETKPGMLTIAPIGDFCGANGGPPDGYVDVWDLMQFADHWHTRTTDSNWDAKFDLAGPDFGNIDGYVDVWDLMVFADNWHTGQKP